MITCVSHWPPSGSVSLFTKTPTLCQLWGGKTLPIQRLMTGKVPMGVENIYFCNSQMIFFGKISKSNYSLEFEMRRTLILRGYVVSKWSPMSGESQMWIFSSPCCKKMPPPHLATSWVCTFVIKLATAALRGGCWRLTTVQVWDEMKLSKKITSNHWLSSACSKCTLCPTPQKPHSSLYFLWWTQKLFWNIRVFPYQTIG